MDRLQTLESIALPRCTDDPAHDALHVRRVAGLARRIAEAEGAQIEIAVAAALLHELFNYPKGHPESHLSGERCADEAERLLVAQGWSDDERARIGYCIRVHSFSRGVVPETLEAKVLQDADRLDAIGAIGVARLFATSQAMRRPFYAVEDPFAEKREPDDKQFGVDHFYRKLLRITFHTPTARALAEPRMRFMREYLEQLAREI